MAIFLLNSRINYPSQLIKTYENSILNRYSSQFISEISESAYNQSEAKNTAEKITIFIKAVSASFHGSLEAPELAHSKLEESLSQITQHFAIDRAIVPSLKLDLVSSENINDNIQEIDPIEESRIENINNTLLKFATIAALFFKAYHIKNSDKDLTSTSNNTTDHLPEDTALFLKSLTTHPPIFNLDQYLLTLNGKNYSIKPFIKDSQESLNKELALTVSPCPYAVSPTSVIHIKHPKDDANLLRFLVYPEFQGQTLDAFITEPCQDPATLLERLNLMMTIHQTLTVAHNHLEALDIQCTDLHPAYIAIEKEQESFKVKVLPQAFSKPLPSSSKLNNYNLQCRAPEQFNNSLKASDSSEKAQWLQQTSWQLGYLFFKVLTGNSLIKEISNLNEETLHAFLDTRFSEIFRSNILLSEINQSKVPISDPHILNESIPYFLKKIFRMQPDKRELLGSGFITNTLIGLYEAVHFRIKMKEKEEELVKLPASNNNDEAIVPNKSKLLDSEVTTTILDEKKEDLPKLVASSTDDDDAIVPIYSSPKKKTKYDLN